MVQASERAELTQEELAVRMRTSQSAIARMESGRVLPSVNSLRKFAEATGSRLDIACLPEKPKRG
jgi:transcriptional regulator with XRE-family HTH domain